MFSIALSSRWVRWAEKNKSVKDENKRSGPYGIKHTHREKRERNIRRRDRPGVQRDRIDCNLGEPRVSDRRRVSRNSGCKCIDLMINTAFTLAPVYEEIGLFLDFALLYDENKSRFFPFTPPLQFSQVSTHRQEGRIRGS